MSPLEIVLYVLIGSATAIYVIVCIVKLIKNRKKKTGDKENENSRDAEDM